MGPGSREALIDFAEKHQIPVPRTSAARRRFRCDANLLHTSSEGKLLEDPDEEAPEYVYQRTLAPEDAPDKPTYVEIGFERGDAVSIDGEALSPASLLARLNDLGGDNGIGRLDLVENRFVGMKSRGIYETPGGTILLAAHRGMESITLDRGAAHLKDELMPRYAELIYNGLWFSPEREMLQAAIDQSQAHVNGTVRLKLYKGSVHVVGRRSPHSLYSQDLVTFEEGSGYDQKDAEGFIKLNALRLRLVAARRARDSNAFPPSSPVCHRRVARYKVGVHDQRADRHPPRHRGRRPRPGRRARGSVARDLSGADPAHHAATDDRVAHPGLVAKAAQPRRIRAAARFRRARHKAMPPTAARAMLLAAAARRAARARFTSFTSCPSTRARGSAGKIVRGVAPPTRPAQPARAGRLVAARQRDTPAHFTKRWAAAGQDRDRAAGRTAA